MFVLDFESAKSQYSFAMCDSFMPKAGPIAIAYLAGWNFNIVEEGAEALLASTSGVGRIEILPLIATDAASKFVKGKLDLRFRIHDSDASAARSKCSSAPLPDPAAIAILNPKVEKKVKKQADSVAGTTSAASSCVSGEAAAAVPAPAAPCNKPKPKTTSAAPEPSDSTPSAVDDSVAMHHGGEGQTITPWEVEAEGGIDYEKLIRVCTLRGRRWSSVIPGYSIYFLTS